MMAKKYLVMLLLAICYTQTLQKGGDNKDGARKDEKKEKSVKDEQNDVPGKDYVEDGPGDDKIELLNQTQLLKRTEEIIRLQEDFNCFKNATNNSLIADMSELLTKMNKTFRLNESTTQIVAEQKKWMTKHVRNTFGESVFSNNITNRIAGSSNSNYWDAYKTSFIDFIYESHFKNCDPLSKDVRKTNSIFTSTAIYSTTSLVAEKRVKRSSNINLLNRTKEIIEIQKAFIHYMNTTNASSTEDMKELLKQMNGILRLFDGEKNINKKDISDKHKEWIKKQVEYTTYVLELSYTFNNCDSSSGDANNADDKNVLESNCTCTTISGPTRSLTEANEALQISSKSCKPSVKTVLIILAPVAVLLIVTAISFIAFKRCRNTQRRLTEPVVNTIPALKTTKEKDEPNLYIYKNIPKKEEDSSHYEDPFSMDKQKSSSAADAVAEDSRDRLYSAISNSSKGVVDSNSSSDIESTYHVLSKKKTKPQIPVCLEGEINEYTNYKKETNDDKADTEEERLYEDLDEISYMTSTQFETDKREVQRRKKTVGWKDQGYKSNLEITGHEAEQKKATSPANKRYSTGLDLQQNPMLLRSCTSPSTQQYSTQLDTNKMLFRQSSSPVHSANLAEQDEDPYQIPEEVLATKQNEAMYFNNGRSEQGLDLEQNFEQSLEQKLNQELHQDMHYELNQELDQEDPYEVPNE